MADLARGREVPLGRDAPSTRLRDEVVLAEAHKRIEYASGIHYCGNGRVVLCVVPRVPDERSGFVEVFLRNTG